MRPRIPLLATDQVSSGWCLVAAPCPSHLSLPPLSAFKKKEPSIPSLQSQEKNQVHSCFLIIEHLLSIIFINLDMEAGSVKPKAPPELLQLWSHTCDTWINRASLSFVRQTHCRPQICTSVPQLPTLSFTAPVLNVRIRPSWRLKMSLAAPRGTLTVLNPKVCVFLDLLPNRLVQVFSASVLKETRRSWLDSDQDLANDSARCLMFRLRNRASVSNNVVAGGVSLKDSNAAVINRFPLITWCCSRLVNKHNPKQMTSNKSRQSWQKSIKKKYYRSLTTARFSFLTPDHLSLFTTGQKHILFYYFFNLLIRVDSFRLFLTYKHYSLCEKSSPLPLLPISWCSRE